MPRDVDGLVKLRVLAAISDQESLKLFNVIATNEEDTQNFLDQTRISRKQYYSRISKLVRAGLIKRKKGMYNLTLLGDMIYEAALKLSSAIVDYSKSVGLEERTEMSKEIVSDAAMKKSVAQAQ